MSFGGTVLAMIQSLKLNARPKHKAFQDWKKADDRIIHTGRKVFLKSVSTEELAQVKEKIRTKSKAEQKRSFIKIVLIIVVLVPVLGFITYQVLFTSFHTTINPYKSTSENPVNTTEQVTYLLNSGYEWLNKNHYRNARFQFKRVLEIQPNNKTASYGLVATYVYECKLDNSNCEEAKTMLEAYILKNGTDQSTEFLNDMLEK